MEARAENLNSKCHDTHAVLFLTTFVNDSLDNGMKVASVFLDIVKAFDCVGHFMLIAKLENYSFRGPFLELLSSFKKKELNMYN